MKSIKHYLNKKYEKHRYKVIGFQTSMILFILSMNTVFAEEETETNTESINSFITFICDWLWKIGGMVAMIGGIAFAVGWVRDDADARVKALLVIMAGFMIMGISQSQSIFGL